MNEPIPNISRRSAAHHGKLSAKKRQRRALLGEVDREGVRRVYAWVENDHIHFHRQWDQEEPTRVSLRQIYRQATAALNL